MPLAGLVLNRVHTFEGTAVAASEGLSAERALGAAEDLAEAGEHALTEGLLLIHADRMHRYQRECGLAQRFGHAHPPVPVARVPARAQDVHDLEGLRAIGAALAGEPIVSE